MENFGIFTLSYITETFPSPAKDSTKISMDGKNS
jgi:hypothetical protein